MDETASGAKDSTYRDPALQLVQLIDDIGYLRPIKNFKAGIYYYILFDMYDQGFRATSTSLTECAAIHPE